MKFNLKGNYYHNSFYKTEKCDYTIKRNCPADLDSLLWEMPVVLEDIEKVLNSAAEGFKTWKKLSSNERCQFLKNYQEVVQKKKNEIAEAISLETGKPLWESHTEITTIINKVKVTIEDSLPRISHKKIESIMPMADGHVYYKPLGPTLIIGPFNFPCHLANGQILNALAAGNSIIFKPSEKTAYSGEILVECFHLAGFPKGVINLMQGDGEVARRLTKSKIIKCIHFTGSVDVGRKILENTYQDLNKLVAVELGGKNFSVVHKDANLNYVLPELLKACFLTAGQRCVSTAIVLMHNNLLEQFVSQFHSLAKKIIIDHPIDFEKEPFMGPLIDQQSLDKYLLFMGMAKREGLDEIMRGKQIEKKYKGHYVGPSIHLGKSYKTTSTFLTSEIFGPNCTIIPYQELDEAVQIINSSEFGLASCLFSEDRKNYEYFIQEVDCGVINFNRSTVGSSAKLPFGGIKNSGNYRPAALTTIDSCVYQMSSIENKEHSTDGLSEIKGLAL